MSNYLTGAVYVFSVYSGRIYSQKKSEWTVYGCSLLLRRECCSFSNGEYVKAGLAELEHWCYNATDEVLRFSLYLFGSLANANIE